MFKINYRLTETEKRLLKDLSEQDLLEGGHIEGYFEIMANDKSYGYYKSGMLHPEEEGFDLITTWFDGLLQVLILLKSGNKEVFLSDVDSYNTWLEFKELEDNIICISVLQTEKTFATNQVITTFPVSKSYSDWKGEKVAYTEMYDEIISKVKKYILEIGHINKKLLQSFDFVRLQSLVDDLENK